jgi:hypothetical protein
VGTLLEKLVSVLCWQEIVHILWNRFDKSSLVTLLSQLNPIPAFIFSFIWIQITLDACFSAVNFRTIFSFNHRFPKCYLNMQIASLYFCLQFLFLTRLLNSLPIWLFLNLYYFILNFHVLYEIVLFRFSEINSCIWYGQGKTKDIGTFLEHFTCRFSIASRLLPSDGLICGNTVDQMERHIFCHCGSPSGNLVTG